MLSFLRLQGLDDDFLFVFKLLDNTINCPTVTHCIGALYTT